MERTSLIRSSRDPAASGFTLIELLVILVIIGILVALLIPAVQAARQSARRAECQNKLKQIGIAVAGHVAQTGYYPPVIPPDRIGESSSVRVASSHLFLLPFLDHGALFDSVNLQFDGRISDGPPNLTAVTTVVDAWICPSDPTDLQPGVSYRTTCGPLPYEIELPPPLAPGGGGVFAGLETVRPSHITDGLSNTVGFSERLRGSVQDTFDSRRDFWFSEFNKIGVARDADAAQSICGSSTDRPQLFWTRGGALWILGRYTDTMYNHVAPPNWSGLDCSLSGEFGSAGDTDGGVFTARSNHSGGVHCLFMDGSVHFQRDTIQIAVWRALASRSGGEILGRD